MGRTQDYWQCTPYNCGTNSIWHGYYHYNLAGDNDWWIHPDSGGFTITNTISTARRITAIQSSWVDSNHPQYLAQSISYTPWGALSTLVNGYAGSGANAQESYQYNNRLQPAIIELGTTGNPTAYDCLVYNYYSGVSNPSSCATPSQGTTNNGNVMGYFDQDSVNAFSHTATYTYDNVNRLTSGVATGSVAYNLTFSYTQDQSNGQYGNMTCVTNGQTNGLCANLSFNAANNHITSTGYTYDGAGNLTKDSSNLTAHTYQWDGEGRVASVDSGSTWSFTYNALGHRVQWAYPGGAYQHFFDPQGGWLGVLGNYDIVRFGDGYLVTYWGNNTVFNHVNNIGSTRMLTNPAGTVAEDMLFYPWGDAWQSAGGGGYNFAKLPIRDLTTNTDLTMARFSSPNFGRWFSPDPIGVKAVRLDDPETWNMYAYVRNNPTNLTDPTGLCDPVVSSGTCKVINGVAVDKSAARSVELDSKPKVQQGWWQKAVGYLYAKHGNGTGLGGKLTLGPLKVEAILKKGEETKFTTGGSATSSVDEAGAKVGVPGAQAGVSVETTQVTAENRSPVDRPSVTQVVPGFKFGEFEGSNGEVGIGIGGCLLVCGELSVGIQADKVLNDIGDAVGKAASGVSDAMAKAISD